MQGVPQIIISGSNIHVLYANISFPDISNVVCIHNHPDPKVGSICNVCGRGICSNIRCARDHEVDHRMNSERACTKGHKSCRSLRF